MNTLSPFRMLVAAAMLAASLPPLRAQDLPYTSGSTGADGALTIPTVFPSTGPRGGAVYHEAEGAAYYISSYYVWKTLDGVTWTRLPDVPYDYYSHGSFCSGQLCYDPTSSSLYALVAGYGAYTDGRWAPRFFKLNAGVWEAVGSGLPEDSSTWEYWSYIRLVYHAANNTLMLFGAGSSYNQTWTFDGTTWTQQAPANSPPGRRNPQMAYDPVRNETVLFGGEGYADTWVWNGSNWSEKPFIINPPSISNCGALWHPGYQGVAIPYTGGDLWLWNGSAWELKHTSGLMGTESKVGFSSVYLPNSSEMLSITNSRTMSLKNDIWSFKVGNPYYIDLKNRPSGVFNYTDVVVPSSINVTFFRNAANTPVIWLASGFVRIDGTVNVSGSSSEGGPGGYDGATGLMINGQGPGGGFPTDQMGGRYFGTYGNPQIEPLIGGSGGGRIDNSQYPSGGGGGAILIAASRDIQVNGTLRSNGGDGHSYWWSGYYTGSGSGGAIKLVADRILGSGSLQANAGTTASGNYGYPNQVGTAGRIRLEAYETDMVDNSQPLASSATTPVWDSGSIASQLEYELNVTHVSGAAVRQPPTGQSSSPDVSFSSDQAVTVLVTGRNIPDGTPVKLTVSGNGINVILPPDTDPPVTMQSGSATFNVTIPAGLGNIQASAAFQKPTTP